MARSIGKRGRPGVEGKEKPPQIPVFLDIFLSVALVLILSQSSGQNDFVMAQR